VPTAESGEGDNHWSDSVIVDSWGSRKAGKKKIWGGQAEKLVFWALYANRFINMFINSLFINQKLKTVYNPLRNYKQDPNLLPDAALAFQQSKTIVISFWFVYPLLLSCSPYLHLLPSLSLLAFSPFRVYFCFVPNQIMILLFFFVSPPFQHGLELPFVILDTVVADPHRLREDSAFSIHRGTGGRKRAQERDDRGGKAPVAQ
jgi:hypothetical protein